MKEIVHRAIEITYIQNLQGKDKYSVGCNTSNNIKNRIDIENEDADKDIADERKSK